MSETPAAQASLCLTFDDNYVDSWFDALPLFEKYGARATFFLSWPERITAAERDKLHQIAAAGHEIGFHTRSHVRLPKYLQNHTLEDYLADQIDAGMVAMNDLGFQPRAFSFPYFRFRPRLIAPMLERFDILRLEGPYDVYHDSLSPRWGNRTVNTYCFTDKTGLELPNAYYADRFDWLQARGGVGVTCGHFIGGAGNKFARTRCTEDDLEGILALARAHRFAFVTMADLARPAPATPARAA